MKRNWIVLLVAAAMLLSLAACGKKDTEDPMASAEPVESAMPTEESVEPDVEDQGAETPEESDDANESDQKNDKSSEKKDDTSSEDKENKDNKTSNSGTTNNNNNKNSAATPKPTTAATPTPTPVDKNKVGPGEYALFTQKSASDVEYWAMETVDLVLQGKWEDVSKRVHYPITINGTTYNDAASFVAAAPIQSFSNGFVRQLTENGEATCHNMISNWQGASMADGILTFSDFDGVLLITGFTDPGDPAPEF